MDNEYRRKQSYSDSQIANRMVADDKIQRDLFGDLIDKYDFDRQKKNQDNRLDIEKKDPVTVERKLSRRGGGGGGGGGQNFNKDNPSPTATAAKLNKQFFVWKNGIAGRLSVDTPFGFKGL